MKTAFFKIALSLFLINIAAIGCTKDGGDVADSFIPNFVNGYGDVDHPGTLFFFTATGTATQGTFTGNQDGTFNFTGTYKNSYLELTFSDGPRATKKFTGNFDKSTTNPYKINLANGPDAIHLKSL